ncbi:hypothetical protein [Colwellia sp. E150_009]
MLASESKKELLFLIQEMSKETELAEKAQLFAVKKHLERLGKLQLRFNGVIARAVCYGK